MLPYITNRSTSIDSGFMLRNIMKKRLLGVSLKGTSLPCWQ